MGPSRMQFVSIATDDANLWQICIRTGSRTGSFGRRISERYVVPPCSDTAVIATAELFIESLGYVVTGQWQHWSTGWVAWCDFDDQGELQERLLAELESAFDAGVLAEL